MNSVRFFSLRRPQKPQQKDSVQITSVPVSSNIQNCTHYSSASLSNLHRRSCTGFNHSWLFEIRWGFSFGERRCRKWKAACVLLEQSCHNVKHISNHLWQNVHRLMIRCVRALLLQMVWDVFDVVAAWMWFGLSSGKLKSTNLIVSMQPVIL